MRFLLNLLTLIFLTSFLYSQDLIVRTNGKTINCEITSVDTSNVNFKVDRNGSMLSKSLPRDQVAEIVYVPNEEKNENELIRMDKVFGTYQFYYKGQKKKLSEVSQILKNNEAAYAKMKSARKAYDFCMVTGVVGGLIVGWPLGTMLGGGEPNFVALGAGMALLGVSITLNSSFNKKAKSAVEMYNNGLKSIPSSDLNSLGFSVSNSGLGLSLRF